MPGYADIGGSWRELNGGGYANIGGSWRQISEGYQNRNGVWEKVFPNYKDYGGDSPDILANEYIDRYGYYNRSITANGNHSSTENQSWNGNQGPEYDAYYSSSGVFHFFSTNDPFDARGYNYLVFIYNIKITTDSPSTTNRNLQVYPIVGLSTSKNVLSTDGGKYITGSNNSATKYMDTSYNAVTFVDISNITSSDLYLLTGYHIYSSYSSSNYSLYGLMRINSKSVVMLYRDKSDCNINGSDYDYSWSISF